MRCTKKLYGSLVLALFLTACSLGKEQVKPIPIPSPVATIAAHTPTVIPTRSTPAILGTTLVSPVATPKPLPTLGNPTEKTWMTLNSPELGLSFKFPQLTGKIGYEYNEWPERNWDPTGTLIAWEVTRPDLHWTYPFAGCASHDMKIGRATWITDLSGWSSDEKKGKYYLEFPGKRIEEIEPLQVVTRTDGLRGLVFVPGSIYNPNNVAKAAVLNLPQGYHPKIKCLSFYFADETSLDDIEAVLRSVTFK